MVLVSLVIAGSGGAAAQESDTPPVIDGGDLRITQPDSIDKDKTHGGSDDPFGVRVPDGAVCPGDSANDNWNLVSFVIPADEDPAALKYNSVGPLGERHRPLVAVTTRPFIDELLQANSGPGSPGHLDLIPPMTFKTFKNRFPPGRYRIGIQCVYFRTAAGPYWDTELIVTEDPDDEPVGIQWRVASAPESVLDDDGGFSLSRQTLAFTGAGLLGLLAVFFAVRSRKSAHAASTIKES